MSKKEEEYFTEKKDKEMEDLLKMERAGYIYPEYIKALEILGWNLKFPGVLNQISKDLETMDPKDAEDIRNYHGRLYFELKKHVQNSVK